jgi:hypothetical protein
MTVNTACPNVFDAGLPALEYDVTATPTQVYPQLLAASAAQGITSARLTATSSPTSRGHGIASAHAICPSKPSVFAMSR